MVSSIDFAAIAELDLEPIKVKLMHQESGEGWSLQKAGAVEFEYRRFLYLMRKFPQCDTAPLFDVDIFWHYHILDTQKYAIDCENVFGYFLHHFPYLGLRGSDDQAAHQSFGAKMRQLYEDTFGEAYIRPPQTPVAHCQSGSSSAADGVAAADQAGQHEAAPPATPADPIQAIWSDARLIDAELAWSDFRQIDQLDLAWSHAPARQSSENSEHGTTRRERHAASRPTLPHPEERARFYAVRPRLTPYRT